METLFARLARRLPSNLSELFNAESSARQAPASGDGVEYGVEEALMACWYSDEARWYVDHMCRTR